MQKIEMFLIGWLLGWILGLFMLINANRYYLVFHGVDVSNQVGVLPYLEECSIRLHNTKVYIT